ncbi:MAG: NF038122 family metalloprotease [Cyanobacteria bacterium P01_F01_bin.143]
MKINFIYDPTVNFAQRIGYEIASIIWGQLFTDNIEVNILARSTDSLDPHVIGGAMPEFHEQHYALFLQYYEADITSEEDQLAFDVLQQGNTVDFLLDGDLVGGNTKLKLTTALAKALGMTEAISLERYILDESEHFVDGTILMNQDFAWDFNYLRNSEAAEETLDFMSVALHEIGHILGFTSSLDFSLEEETLFSSRTELSNFSPLDLFRFSAESLAQNNPDGVVNDLSIGGTAWFSTDGGETLSAKMSTGKEGDGFQASHWERRYDPLGIMDPTLWYQERAEITDLDVLAFDIIGYDLSSEANDVEDLFEEESLEVLLAQAKVQLAYKMGITVQELENNTTNVPLSSPELIAEIEAIYLETAATGDSTTENPGSIDSSSGSGLDSLSDEELDDFFKDLDQTMEDFYRWWTTSGGSQNASWQEFYEWWAQSSGNQGSSWQEFYEWWAQNSGNQGSSWQELYEWWAQNSGNQGSSWQELYEWWAQSSGNQGSSWQELYEWWAQSSGNQGSSWQELYEWWAQSSGNQGSWWQEVFFSSQDESSLEDMNLPGESNYTTNGPIYYQEYHGSQDDDIISGDVSDDNITAGNGDDLIDGAEGNDTIFGADGYDTIFGFDGNDSIMGGAGDDVISGESDEDALFGEAGADILMGGDHDDYLDGGAGRDFLNGNTGHDALMGGAGDDALEGESGKDMLVGGDGIDIVNGGSGDDSIFGDQYSASLQETVDSNISSLSSLFTPESASETSGNSGSSETNTEELNTMVVGQDSIIMEAENMTLSEGYYLDNYYYDGSVIRTNSNNPNGIAGSEFSGEAGYYQVLVRYIDESDGNASLSVKIADTEIDSWVFNQNTSGYNTYYSRIISESMYIDANAAIEIQGQTESSEYARVDYIEFIPVEPSQTIEAENMTLSGGYYIDNSYYDGSVIRTNYNNPNGIASSEFNGETGYYKVIVRYIDESDGDASLSVKIADTEIDNWILTQNTNGSNEYYSRTISEGIYIDANALIEIQGQAESAEYARIDHIKFIPVEPPQTIETNTDSDSSNYDFDNLPSELGLGVNSDILRGGFGNDGIDGGEGNDIIFGEDEFNDSRHINAPNIGDTFTYGHSSYLLTSQALTWEEAQAEAESYGGNLVTINDVAEQQRLNEHFGFDEKFWIGFTDSEQEGVWEWASGEKVTQTDWHPYQPNNSFGQDYAVINHNHPLLLGALNQWNDVSSSEINRGIIEIDWSSVGGNDTILGGIGDDQIYGNSGNDLIFGDQNPILDSLNHGLVGHWTFDEGSGTQALDLSGSNHGTLKNFPTDGFQRVNGQVGNALDFDGADDLVEVADAPELNLDNQITLAAWVNADNLSDWSGIITKGNSSVSYSINLMSDRRIGFYTNWKTNDSQPYGEWFSDSKITTNQWQHIAVTYDGSAINFYINGQLDSNIVDKDFDFATTDQPLLLGNDLVANQFDGSIDEARVYDRALNDAEITQLFDYQNNNDNLFGNGGHDTLEGGAGNDTLNGTDEVVAGYLERDVLIGGAGIDTFILGDETQAYYATEGSQDYAVIEDFNPSIDQLQLHGVADDYQQQQQGNDLHLSRDGDLVAILENNKILNLSDNAFEYLN